MFCLVGGRVGCSWAENVAKKVGSDGDRVVDVGDEVGQVTMVLRSVRMERCRCLYGDRSEQIRTRKHERVATERHFDSFSPLHRLRAAGCLERLQPRRQTDQRISRQVVGGQDIENEVATRQAVADSLSGCNPRSRLTETTPELGPAAPWGRNRA